MAAPDGGILVTPELLRQRASKLTEYSSEHDTAINNIRNLVNGLTDEFSGQAASAFLQKFSEMEPTFKQFSESLKTLSDNLVTVANELEARDRELAGRIGSTN